MTTARPPRARTKRVTPDLPAAAALHQGEQAKQDSTDGQPVLQAQTYSVESKSYKTDEDASKAGKTASAASKVVPAAAAAPAEEPEVTTVPIDLTQVRVRKAAKARYAVPINSRLAADVADALEEHRATTGELNVDLFDRALRIVLADELARLAGPGTTP